MSFSQNPLVQRLGRIAGVLAAIVVFVAGMAWIGSAQDKAKEPQTLVTEANASDWYVGGENAPVTIVEYSDFECPACAAYYPVMKELAAAYGDQIKIVYRHFPLTQIHKNATLAAQAAEAAGLQGKFFEMHDVLFEEQQVWSEISDPTDTFVGYAAALELNTEQFRDDLKSSTVRDAVSEDARSGLRAKVSSTPSFFLNGTLIESPRGLQPFTDIINAELAKTVAPVEATTDQPTEETPAE